MMTSHSFAVIRSTYSSLMRPRRCSRASAVAASAATSLRRCTAAASACSASMSMAACSSWAQQQLDFRKIEPGMPVGECQKMLSYNCAPYSADRVSKGIRACRSAHTAMHYSFQRGESP